MDFCKNLQYFLTKPAFHQLGCGVQKIDFVDLTFPFFFFSGHSKGFADPSTSKPCSSGTYYMCTCVNIHSVYSTAHAMLVKIEDQCCFWLWCIIGFLELATLGISSLHAPNSLWILRNVRSIKTCYLALKTYRLSDRSMYIYSLLEHCFDWFQYSLFIYLFFCYLHNIFFFNFHWVYILNMKNCDCCY